MEICSVGRQHKRQRAIIRADIDAGDVNTICNHCLDPDILVRRHTDIIVARDVAQEDTSMVLAQRNVEPHDDLGGEDEKSCNAAHAKRGKLPIERSKRCHLK